MIVDRLINHGAIIIGKTNVPEFAVGAHTNNKLFGPTANVYDTNSSAGGSSGGSAAAIAAELVPMSDGSDMMGSCRIPAAFSNIYGIRPTPGLIPVERNASQKIDLPHLSTAGCLARTPSDMSLMLDAISGKHPLDPFSFEEGILELCEKALQALEQHKLQVDLIKIDMKTNIVWDSWTTLRASILYQDIIDMKLENIGEMHPGIVWEHHKGQNITDDDISNALNQRNACMHEIDNLFNKFDFLALPAAQIFPFDKETDYPKKIGNTELDTYHRWMEVAALASLLGLPTISVPVGFNKEGLPMGMQIIAKKGKDLELVAFAKKYEEIFLFSKYRPKNFN